MKSVKIHIIKIKASDLKKTDFFLELEKLFFTIILHICP